MSEIINRIQVIIIFVEQFHQWIFIKRKQE